MKWGVVYVRSFVRNAIILLLLSRSSVYTSHICIFPKIWKLFFSYKIIGKKSIYIRRWFVWVYVCCWWRCWRWWLWWRYVCVHEWYRHHHSFHKYDDIFNLGPVLNNSFFYGNNNCIRYCIYFGVGWFLILVAIDFSSDR